MAGHKAKKRPARPSFKLPDSFKDRTTKSGSKTKIKTKKGGKTPVPKIYLDVPTVLGKKKKK